MTIFEANVYDQNAEPDAAAAKILASGADVLVVVEMDSRTLQALRRQGVDQTYPYSTLPGGRYRTDAIWSKHAADRRAQPRCPGRTCPGPP